ncbi:hypothetical protein O9929_05435 [Vibrio lentus]|nr:hypothetical protein [Vibrio lentus]
MASKLCNAQSLSKAEMSSLYKKSNVDTGFLFTFSQGIEGKISASIASILTSIPLHCVDHGTNDHDQRQVVETCRDRH